MPTMESHSNTHVFSLLSKKGGDSVSGLVRGSPSDTQLYVLFHVWTLGLHGTLSTINMVLFLSLLVAVEAYQVQVARLVGSPTVWRGSCHSRAQRRDVFD